MPQHCQRARPSSRDPWCCRVPAWPLWEHTAATARTVASCTLCPCSWGVSSLSVSWAVLGGAWSLPKWGFVLTQPSLCAGWACGMGDSSLTAASPGPQTCLESPLCPAEHLTMRTFLAPGPPVWRPSSPPDTSPHTGEVSPQGMDWACYGVSSGSQPRITTKSIRPSHTRPKGSPPALRTVLHPRAGPVLG